MAFSVASHDYNFLQIIFCCTLVTAKKANKVLENSEYVKWFDNHPNKIGRIQLITDKNSSAERTCIERSIELITGDQ